ncbi:MAG TPA: glycosyltransferase, partial [Porphyromonadaceae bacterium]|nr:glycosyltransferase [Porphyromonadaceae bacterium]
MKSVTVIVPCYNEELVILESYTRISTVLSSIDYDSCILFVNDGSSDATLKILRGIAEKDNRVSVLSFSRNFGHQAAVSAGINHCATDFAIIIDADLQDPPEVIPDILRMQQTEQANVVYCVRKERKGEGTFKKTTAKWFYRMLNAMSDTNFPVDTGDFRLIDRKIIDQFDQLTERGKYIRGLISWMGFKQVPF